MFLKQRVLSTQALYRNLIYQKIEIVNEPISFIFNRNHVQMRKILALTLLILCSLFAIAQPDPEAGTEACPTCEWDRIYLFESSLDCKAYKSSTQSDHFDYEGAPDPTKWKTVMYGDENHPYARFGKYEEATYCDENVWVEDGVCKIKAEYHPSGTSCTSLEPEIPRYFSTGVLWSQEPFTNGRFTARVKLPESSHWWSAFWLWHHDEIDIFENFGNKDKYKANVYSSNCAESEVFKPSENIPPPMGNFDPPFEYNLREGFHTYSVEITPFKIKFFYTPPWADEVQLTRVHYRFYNENGEPLSIECGDVIPGGYYYKNPVFPEIRERNFNIIAGFTALVKYGKQIGYNEDGTPRPCQNALLDNCSECNADCNPDIFAPAECNWGSPLADGCVPVDGSMDNAIMEIDYITVEEREYIACNSMMVYGDDCIRTGKKTEPLACSHTCLGNQALHSDATSSIFLENFTCDYNDPLNWTCEYDIANVTSSSAIEIIQDDQNNPDHYEIKYKIVGGGPRLIHIDYFDDCGQPRGITYTVNEFTGSPNWHNGYMDEYEPLNNPSHSTVRYRYLTRGMHVSDNNQVFYRGDDQYMKHYWYDSGPEKWQHTTLVNNWTDYARIHNNSPIQSIKDRYVIYRGDDNLLQGFQWNTDTGWEHTFLFEEKPLQTIRGDIKMHGNDLFYVGIDDHIKCLKYNEVADTWTPDFALDNFSGQTSEMRPRYDSPIEIAKIGDTEYIFYIGSTSKVQYYFRNNSGWGHAFIMNGQNNYVWAEGDLEVSPNNHVFFRASNGRMNHLWWSNSATPADWQHHLMPLPTSNNLVHLNSTIAIDSNNKVIYRGADNLLQHYFWSGSMWVHLYVGNNPTVVTGEIAIAPNDQIFFRGGNHYLNHYWFSNTTNNYQHSLLEQELTNDKKPRINSPILVNKCNQPVYINETHHELRYFRWGEDVCSFSVPGAKKKAREDKEEETKEEVLAINQFISVFPNPAYETVSVKMDGLKNQTISTFKIVNSNGQIVQERKVDADHQDQVFQFNMNTSAAGLYYVLAIDEIGNIVSTNSFVHL